MSDERGEIRVTGFSYESDGSPMCYGASGRPFWHRDSYSVRLDMVMDREGLRRFLAIMEQIAPGFRQQHASSVPPLPETTRALPCGPIDAEFVDD